MYAVKNTRGNLANCFTRPVPREALDAVALPKTTATYTPVPHRVLADLIEERLLTIGAKVVDEAHCLSANDGGKRYFGLYGLDLIGEGFSLVLGFRNSLDKRIAASGALGSQVLVCTNLAFSGEYLLSRKHTTHVMKDLPPLIDAMLAHAPKVRASVERQFDAYKMARLTEQEADHLLLKAYRAGAIPAYLLNKVMAEWFTPSYDEFQREEYNGWRLFNAFTTALKAVGVDKGDMRGYAVRTIALHRVFMTHFGLDAASPAL